MKKSTPPVTGIRFDATDQANIQKILEAHPYQRNTADAVRFALHVAANYADALELISAGDAAVVSLADDEDYFHADELRDLAKSAKSLVLSRLLNEFAAALDKSLRKFNQE